MQIPPFYSSLYTRKYLHQKKVIKVRYEPSLKKCKMKIFHTNTFVTRNPRRSIASKSGKKSINSI